MSHGTPSFRERKPLPIQSITDPGKLAAIKAGFKHGSFVRAYFIGECSVIITVYKNFYHMSISHRDRHPTWDEIAEARYRLLPRDRWFALPLPPEGDYVNLRENCYQVLECPKLEEPE